MLMLPLITSLFHLRSICFHLCSIDCFSAHSPLCDAGACTSCTTAHFQSVTSTFACTRPAPGLHPMPFPIKQHRSSVNSLENSTQNERLFQKCERFFRKNNLFCLKRSHHFGVQPLCFLTYWYSGVVQGVQAPRIHARMYARVTPFCSYAHFSTRSQLLRLKPFVKMDGEVRFLFYAKVRKNNYFFALFAEFWKLLLIFALET